MEYDDLYDESPYASSKNIFNRGRTMGAMRLAFLVFAGILVSIFVLSFDGYWQDQFIISTSNDYVAIFDKKSKTMNICNRTHCTLVTPRFPDTGSYSPSMGQQKSWLSRLFDFPQWSKGNKEDYDQRLLGSFPQHQQTLVNPQMTPQMWNPQMTPQVPPHLIGQPHQTAWNPQITPQIPPQLIGQPQQLAQNPQIATEPNDFVPDEGDEEAAPI